MRIEHLTKKYGARTALSDISFDIEAGKITAVLGESGAGKTTLLNAIAGVIGYEGAIEGVGAYSYLFQSPKLLPNLTAEDNLKFVLPKTQWGGIGDMLEKVGLAGRERAYPRSLSGGERQRVAIARAFLYPHDLLLMDEPFSSLDLALKKTLIELVVRLWRERRETVVFVTHDVHEAAMLSHRAVVLHRGAVALDLAVEGELPRDFFSRPPCEERLVRALTGEEG